MWIGIVVLCTFALAALASLVLSVRGALRREWHLAITFLVPAVGIGGPIAMLAGPAMWIWLFGNPDLRTLPESATQITASDLGSLIPGRTVVGMYYEKGKWQHFQEEYMADGNLRGSGGPDDNPTQFSWSGSWKLDGDQMCWKYDQDFSCSAVYRDGDRYDAVNDSNEINNWFKPTDATSE